MSCIVFVNIQSAGKIPNNNAVHEKKKIGKSVWKLFFKLKTNVSVGKNCVYFKLMQKIQLRKCGDRNKITKFNASK
jgi:hypothetical protein